MVIKPKRFLWTPDGRYHYVRRGGKYTRIMAAFGTEEFDRQYWDILRGAHTTSRTSWAKLIESYRKSQRWTLLRGRTRSDYEQVLTYLLSKNAGKDVTRTKRPDILAAMQVNQHRTRFSNLIPSVMAVLLEHAIDLGWMQNNPAKGVRRAVVPEERRQPHIPWPDEAVAKFRAEASPTERLILEIGIGTVQRPADWCVFRWEDFDGEALRIVQGKTGTALRLPCTPNLLAALGDDWRGRTGVILRGRDNQPLNYPAMALRMLKERKRLGLAAYDLHALRYRGVQELARAGCTDEEIASFSGHESLAMIRLYAGTARQEARAQQALAKRGNG